MEWKIVHIDETDSTNRWLKNYATADKHATGTVVVANYQTAGRGCGTNTWESERGKNLLFSILVHPADVLAADQFILSMANALALSDTLSDYADDVSIKWPNDIYWKDSKLCGTLIETTLQGNHIMDCIIGTGINVNQTCFLSDAPNPISLCQILGHAVDRDEVLQKVLDNLAKYMEMIRAGHHDVIRKHYRRQLYRMGETHLYRFADGQEAYCKLVNVTDDGHLELLHDNRETYLMAFKEVQFVI
ncbi:MAG: biotin--[Prevotella sp.]|nr:biotin--[acetyl-CoA-carboxylase] ligase [Prevotella sp.]